MKTPQYPGIKVTTNGNQLIATTEARIVDCGVFYPITPSTEQGEYFEMSVSQGILTVFGDQVKAIEAEGEHAAQGGAIAISVTGKRVANFTSGQGIVYGLEQYYHAPGKLSTMVVNIGARALTKHALNVHCGHDDIMAAMDTGWIMLMAKDAQQAVDQSIILRKVTELSLTPGMNIQDGFLTTHLERTFKKLESELLRTFLGHPNDIIKTPTPSQVELFGPHRRRIPQVYSRKTPALLGSVQNQEHYMTGVISRRIDFYDYILEILQKSYEEFGQLTGRNYKFITHFNTETSDTLFLSLGSSAENIEAACTYLQKTRGISVGCLHLNVLRPFPVDAMISSLQGKKMIIILERTDEPLSCSNPLAREVRATLSTALQQQKITRENIPLITEGVYGLGSRDFRPEHVIGAYDYSMGKIARQDGKFIKDGEFFFYLGVQHPYAVISTEKPSLLPESTISVRFHSIGGWGAITTGKNMAEILGDLAPLSHIIPNEGDDVIHISANPKYGSEKKGSPTNYFLAVARERIKVNCDLHHVDVVLCCDPKIFTHTNPLSGLRPGGSFVWESQLTFKEIWSKIPLPYRKLMIDKNIQLFTLNGFEIAKNATNVGSLQTRMQGNSFLGGFFKISSFLKDHGIEHKVFLQTVLKQYEKKFGKFGQEVVDSNMQVMKLGFENIKKHSLGDLNTEDLSDLTGEVILPQKIVKETFDDNLKGEKLPALFNLKDYEKQFKLKNIEDQQSSPLTSTGIMPGATSEKNSKFVSRIQTPVIDPYLCTQCMSCIEVCPDTALPNTSQNIESIVKNLFENYIEDKKDRMKLHDSTEKITLNIRNSIDDEIAKKAQSPRPIVEMILSEVKALGDIRKETISALSKILSTLPLGYGKARSIYQMLEKKKTGTGGLFSIFVSDLCKGCGECVDACGDHMALKMVDEDESVRGKHLSAIAFYNTLPETPKKYLGLYDPNDLANTRAAILQNHLMTQKNYHSFASGDGACAGCGEKSVIRGIVTMTEALMTPIFKTRSQRMLQLSKKISENGREALGSIQKRSSESYKYIQYTLAHIVLGLGAENIKETTLRMQKDFNFNDDTEVIDALVEILLIDSYNHKEFKIIEGRSQGMTVMGMTANTGCNTVYGSTHPSNPHRYPWMNSLFQDGTTIGWLVAESFMLDHARSSIIPERLAHLILEGTQDFSEKDYLELVHLNDTHMTDLEILELPKVWVVGGDGGIGDIGFQNLSKVILQNRPNVQILMVDTQVYSNTGGQNSDSSVMPGGFDMNQFGHYSEGKFTERKEVAQILTSGHGSPYVASVSMANSAKFFKSVLDGLLYRGTAYLQSFTTCQPEHGVADNLSTVQALKIRDSRGAPEFVYNPQEGEYDNESYNLKGNPSITKDWGQKKDKNKQNYTYTIPQWAHSEGRFRKHFYKIAEKDQKVHFEDLILRVTQNDIRHKYFLNPKHRSFCPHRGIYMDIITDKGEKKRMGISRQLLLFSVERRKNWRRLQSKAVIRNKDYEAQKILLQRFEDGTIKPQDFYDRTASIHKEILTELN